MNKHLETGPHQEEMSKSENQQTIEAYNILAEDYAKVNPDRDHYKPQIERFASLAPEKSVADLGCGTGRDAKAFTELGFTYTGIDGSEGMLAQAKELNKEAVNNNTAHFEQMDFGKLEYKDDTFGGFWAAASFLHIKKEDLGAVLKEVIRVTKPHGVGFISIAERKPGEQDGFKNDERYPDKPPRYFAFYNAEEFKQVLEQAGLEVIDVKKKENTQWLHFFVRKP